MQFLNPTHEGSTQGFEPPPRLATLAGATIGVISNGKEKTEPFFDLMEQQLRNRFGVAQIVRRVKRNYSAPAQAELIAEAKGWDAVLAGVGD